MKQKFLLTILCALASSVLLNGAHSSASKATQSEISNQAITYGQVIGRGATQNAAYGDAYSKIPSGYTPLKVYYTSSTTWICNIDYGK